MAYTPNIEPTRIKTGISQLTPQMAIDINRYGFVNRSETQLTFDGINLFTIMSIGASCISINIVNY